MHYSCIPLKYFDNIPNKYNLFHRHAATVPRLQKLIKLLTFLV